MSEPTMFADIDSLCQIVRNPVASDLFREAVKCYHAGAYRASVVAAWTACSIDIILKLRELELTGDKAAKKRLGEYDSARSKNDIPKLLEFERNLLDMACDEFELITTQEREDLSRLLSDRHRCAHTTLLDTDEPYLPTPEQVRAHLRAVAESVLIHPPVQGKAAMRRLLDEVNSDYFPKRSEDAMIILRAGPLERPRRALLRNYLVVLIKCLLRYENDIPIRRWKCFAAALGAVKEMYPDLFVSIIQTELPDLTTSLSDEQLVFLLSLVVWYPDLLPKISEAAKLKLESYISAMLIDEVAVSAIARGIRIPELKDMIISRISIMNINELATALASQNVAELSTEDAVINRAIELFHTVSSYVTANNMLDKVMTILLPHLNRNQLESLLNTIAESPDYRNAYSTPSFLSQLRSIIGEEDFIKECQKRQLDKQFPALFPPPEAYHEYNDIPF
ncbi:MAG TPA: hypothetical protein PL067_10695 [Bacteroidales bacterium]|nr:hypothetical protein [Candidatus Fermentibacter daniensis]HPO41171.1 hypothetical protein [Bacteroidales bacterium]